MCSCSVPRQFWLQSRKRVAFAHFAARLFTESARMPSDSEREAANEWEEKGGSTTTAETESEPSAVSDGRSADEETEDGAAKDERVPNAEESSVQSEVEATEDSASAEESGGQSEVKET